MPAPLTATDARVALLADLVDHAPMFPPAELPLAEALDDHERARASGEAWLVGRFVCRASRLAELPFDRPARLSVVVDVPLGDLPADGRVEALELPLPERLDGLAERAPEVYVEVAPGADIEPIAAAGLRAKVRCGGASIPAVEELAGFVRRCRGLGLPFKATAGLHHAVRGEHEHGFLNLLAAALFGDEERALDERDTSAFTLDAGEFTWRDRRAGAGEAARMRRELFTGFGSCSFAEPIEELRALGMLPR